ncbi:hypothetical protein BKA70DRAFT_1393776 [Coprinopsis sp. MPI-PUGE-AT-0042]|nr:hypothetical protein BKA70DRAFT_1393776 [Coprinopsis sp. MPI-PUGE-AT-0042]
MSTIFLNTLQGPTDPLSLSSSANVIAKVCHRWREIAHNTSVLWTDLYVNIEIRSPWDFSSRRQLCARTHLQGAAILRCLARAQKSNARLLVDISEEMPPRRGAGDGKGEDPGPTLSVRTVGEWIVDQICSEKYAQNVKSLCLRKIYEPYLLRFHAAPPSAFSSLEHLEINNIDARRGHMPYFEDDCRAPLLGNSKLLRAPKLSSLKLVEPQTLKRFKLGDLPLRLTHNLKALDICGRLYTGRYHDIYSSVSFDRDELLSVIWNSSQTLEVLRVGVAPPSGGFSEEQSKDCRQPLKIFHRLKVISLHELNSSGWRLSEIPIPHLRLVMARMVTPILESLAFSPGRNEVADASSLIVFLETNRANLSQLRHLRVDGYDNLRMGEFQNLLDIVGSGSVLLTSLALLGGGQTSIWEPQLQPGMAVLSSEILARFSPSAGQGALFPHLRSFEWWGQMVEEFDAKDLSTFLRYRLSGMHGLAKLKDVDVSLCRKDETVLRVGQQFEGLGVDVASIQVTSTNNFKGHTLKVSFVNVD